MIIRFLLILIFIYLLSFIVRRLFTRPFQEGYREREEDIRKRNSRKSEGRVSIFTNGAGKSHDNKEVGEYIDYEEVKDEDESK